ncbi:MAG: KEOPS complex subunit Cgi121 [Methanothrix sp.]|nr:KEOPS complex subunit Cgi121 [Methanothrix sp.]MDD4447353.1 KEOPS complex subunit Cgi121 [Methanothrix sp.]
MNEIRLLFGKPVIRDKWQLISAIKDLKSRHGCIVQAFDADKIASERHLRFAVQKALTAFSEARNIAKDEGMEIMRYASGERQIERALFMRVSDITQRIALVIVGFGSQPDASELSRIIELDGLGCSFSAKAVIEAFNISSEELCAVGEERIEDLVIERVALVDTYR